MAARINVKFAIALAAAILVVGAAGIGVAYLAVSKTGEEHVLRGDEALAAGDVQLAAQSYSKAVAHDRTRLDWLEKWRSALIQLTPETQADYERSFNQHYLGILERMAVLEPFDPARQRDLLDSRYEQAMTLFPTNVQSWQQFADLAGQRTETLDESDPEARALRRYRGLAILNQMRLTDIDPSVSQQGLADLVAASEADPSDIETARGIVLWRLIRWRQAHLDRREIEARQSLAELESAMTAFRESFPGHHDAALTDLEVRIERVNTIEVDELSRRAALRAMLGDEAPVIESFRQADPLTVTEAQLGRLNLVLGILGSPVRNETMIELVERVEDAAGPAPQLTTLKAEAYAGQSDYAKAIEVTRAFLDRPIAPVSLQGLLQRYYRPSGLQKLAEYALALWELEPEGEAKAEALTLAKDAYAELSETTRGGEESDPALIVRGKLAQAENRAQEAIRIFTELVEKRGYTDAETRLRLAQVLREGGQLGAAKRQSQAALDEEPTNLSALLSLADAHVRLKERDEARAVVATIRELYPNLEGLDRLEQRLETLLRDDPVGEAINSIVSRARELRRDGNEENLDAARALVRRGLEEHPNNVPLTIELVNIEAQAGQVDEARRVVVGALAANPGNATLERLQRAMAFDDPYRAAFAMVEDSDLPPARKLLRQYTLAQRYNRESEAERLLATLRDEHGRDPAAIEVLFTEAVKNEDMDEARRIVEIAASVNADQANGLVYQGRLELINERHQAAVETLRQAVEILPYSPMVQMMLGEAELKLGLVGEGLASLARAYDSKPDDAMVARRYASLLVDLQRWDEALEVLRSAVRFNPLDLALRDAWLSLEDRAGDAELALRERRETYEAYPTNQRNAMALAQSLIKNGNYDEAESVIAELESDGRSLDTAMLRARLAAVRDGVSAGQRVLTEHLAEADDPDAAGNAALGLANFLFEFERPDAAVEVLTEARPQQSDRMEIDRRLGDHYFGTEQLDLALRHYEAINQSIPDDELVKLRLAETLAKLERFEEAEAMLGRINDAENNVTAVLIRGRAAAAEGRERDARALFDRAVELRPNDPLPFLQRASYSAQFPDQFNDALADLDRAIQLAPDSMTARQLKAEMLASRGRLSEAIAEVRRAAEANPQDDDLRTLLIRLSVQNDDYAAAIDVAERTSRDRDEDPYWIRVAADLAARAAEVTADPDRRADLWTTAAERYAELFEIDSSDQMALRVANARLQQREPDPSRALELVEQMSEETRQQPNIQMLRARALHELGREDEALRAASASIGAVQERGQMRVWFQQLDEMLKSPLAAGRFAEDLTPPSEFRDLYDLLLVVRLSPDPNRTSELLATLDRLDGSLSAREDRIDFYRQRGRLLFGQQDYRGSAEAFASALELEPNDLEFNNNLAYLRTTFLDDAEGALEPAERAARLNPQSPTILDTLGWVYFQTGRKMEAQQSLQQARQYATTPAEFVPIEVHLAFVYLDRGDLPQARRMYTSARERLLEVPGLASVYAQKLETLRAQLEETE